MASNIELKARARDWDAQLSAARRAAGPPAAVLLQEDRFFRVPEGRLKLRTIEAEPGDRASGASLSPEHCGGDGRASAELIFYRRPDAAGPKRSDYRRVPVAEPAALAALLEESLGALGTVRKRRTLFLTGPARLHFDEVEGLGRFLELELVLGPGLAAAEGEAEARRWMERLGIRDEDLLEGAYLDLTARR